MKAKFDWLRGEIDQWAAELIISPAQRDVLRRRYQDPGAVTRTPWGLILFSCTGAVVVALGIILLLAHNWTKIPRVAKLAVLFAGVAGSHLAALRWVAAPDWRKYIGGAAALFGSMLFGSGIWLIAQIYNVSAHYPEGFLYWGIGTLLLAWALESAPQAILATVLLTVWGSAETWDFHNATVYPLFIIAAAVGPLAWRTHSALLAGMLLAGLTVLSFGHIFEYGDGSQVFMFIMGAGTLLLGGAKLAESRATPEFKVAPVLRFFGYVAFLGCAYFLSFRLAPSQVQMWSQAGGRHPYAALVQIWAVFVLAAFAWLSVARLYITKRWRCIYPEEWLCPIALIYVYTAIFNLDYLEAFALAPVFNLVLLAYCTAWMLRGCRETRLGPTIVGSALFALVLAARYFDLFETMVARGVAFVILGVILFAEAYYFHRTKTAGRPEAGA